MTDEEKVLKTAELDLWERSLERWETIREVNQGTKTFRDVPFCPMCIAIEDSCDECLWAKKWGSDCHSKKNPYYRYEESDLHEELKVIDEIIVGIREEVTLLKQELMGFITKRELCKDCQGCRKYGMICCSDCRECGGDKVCPYILQ